MGCVSSVNVLGKRRTQFILGGVEQGGRGGSKNLPLHGMAHGLKLMNSFLMGLSKERFRVAVDGGLVKSQEVSLQDGKG